LAVPLPGECDPIGGADPLGVVDDQAVTRSTKTPVRLGPEELVDDRYLLDTFLEHTPDHVYFKDAASRFLRISRSLSDWLGLAEAAEAIGRTDFDFFAADHARRWFADEQKLIRTGEPLVGLEERESWPDGRETWVSTTKVPLCDRQGEIVGLFGISRDITEKKQAETRLAEQALQLELQAQALEQLTAIDELTGLRNRRGLLNAGEELLYQCRVSGRLLSILFLDLDGLKQINDSHGHLAGDAALRAVAQAIVTATRETDLAGRVGGDEFCVLVPTSDAATTAQIGDRIETALAAISENSQYPFQLSISTGSVQIDPRTPGPLNQLLAQADQAMYAAKANSP
jgi:diguanylate cyclase (GGDEF)-like protein/PAS domain S-box-containing protein